MPATRGPIAHGLEILAHASEGWPTLASNGV